MARAGAARAVRAHKTLALVLGRVDYGEADLVVTLFSETLGRVSAMARAARKSTRRFGGALEPIHTLSVALDERTGSELYTLREASLQIVRRHIVSDLGRLEAAGKALGWLRRSAPARTAEPEVWAATSELFERLDQAEFQPRLQLAEYGLRLLSAVGWGIDFERCVRCGRACPPDQTAMVDAARGGLVCRACGGARLRLAAATRGRLSRTASGELGVLTEDDLDCALALVEHGLSAHVGAA
jgi:DNA repair protein RecO (recombination protein O)